MGLFRNAVRTLFGSKLPAQEPSPTPPEDWVRPALRDLLDRIETVERGEALRAAEHAATLDRLDRLYKRVSRRIARAGETDDSPNSDGESVLSLRQRVHR